jgi:hypothetical protein
MAAGSGRFWLASGANHFLHPKFYKSIVPPPLDRWKGPVNVAAGVAELAGGAAILPERARPAALVAPRDARRGLSGEHPHGPAPGVLSALFAGGSVGAAAGPGPLRLAHVGGDATTLNGVESRTIHGAAPETAFPCGRRRRRGPPWRCSSSASRRGPCGERREGDRRHPWWPGSRGAARRPPPPPRGRRRSPRCPTNLRRAPLRPPC